MAAAASHRWARPLTVGRTPQAIRSGDFDGDGYSDLAVANYSDGTVTTFLNNQNGTFTANTIRVGSGAGSGPQALAIHGTGSSLLLAVAQLQRQHRQFADQQWERRLRNTKDRRRGQRTG